MIWEQPEVVEIYSGIPHLSKAEWDVVNIFKTYDVKRILDLGCGAGRTTKILRQNFDMVIGTDISRPMIEKAQKLHPDINFNIASATNLPYADEWFDAVFFSFNGLDYLYPETEREKALREIKRVLKPGGLFAYSSHNSWALPIRKDRLINLFRNLPRISSRYYLDYRPFGAVLTYHGSPIQTDVRKYFTFIKTLAGKYPQGILSWLKDPYLYHIFQK